MLGLDYHAIEFLFKLHEVEDQRDLMERLQAMEGAALAVLNR